MELYAKGQLSYLILNCLLERDFYGLDIIAEINSKSRGKVTLKKPSVYSNLTRMEKQGYVSSYLKSSELGPNRKYYSITDSGRDFYDEIDQYFSRNKIDILADFQEETTIEQQKIPTLQEEKKIDENNDDFFDFSELDESSISINEEEQTADTEIIDNTQNIEVEKNATPLLTEEQEINAIAEDNRTDFSIKNVLLSEKNDEKSNKDDAKFLEKQDTSSYNQHLYDISKDINSYKKKKSFAEEQISISSEAPLLSSSNEKRKADLEEFKSSLLQNKDKYLQQDAFSNFSNYKDKLESIKSNTPTASLEKEDKTDDGKFIIAHIDESTVEKPRKIEPPKLKIIPENGKEKLPAPKRDASIDPSHQEILSRLYAKTKGSSPEEQREDCLYDYNDLKDFYKNQNIAFDIYKKPNTKAIYNTNKLYFVMSLITFLASGTCSALLYVIFSGTTMLNTNFNFLYILLPALLLIDVGLKYYNMIKYKGWLPQQITPQWKIWTIAVTLIVVCVGLNFAFGMAESSFNLFATTLILPILYILILLPLRYYIKRYLLINKWE